MRLHTPAALLLLTRAGLAAESARPRGVGPEYAKFYTDAATFSCISDPRITIPRARVNDDYCDCPDGSDEPGTAACAHVGLSSNNDSKSKAALPGFYCKNKGHNPGYVPFANVNDGVCDHVACCDGSDEWDTAAKCPDRCAEIGEQWRAVDAKRQIGLAAASKARAELVRLALEKRKEIEGFLESTKGEMRALEARVKALERAKNAVEKSEKSKVVRKEGAGGKMAVLKGLVGEKVGFFKESLAYLKGQREQERARVLELEALLASFKAAVGSSPSDEGVKHAVKAWDDYSARGKPAAEEARDRDADDLIATSDDGISWEEFESEEPQGLAGDIETLFAFEEYLPNFIKEWLDVQLRGLRQMLVDNGILPPTPSEAAATDSPAVQAAKEKLLAAETEVTNLESRRRQSSDDLEKDFGPDDVFRTLDKKCISMDSGEYTYELCMLEGVTQKPKKGGSQNSMGRFSRFEKVVVDDLVGDDGRGLGSGERLAMVYDNGAACWQGPARSTTVIMACFETDEVWKVLEEEKCVYRMEVGTPAACEASTKGAAKDGQAAKQDTKKDEL